MYKVILYFSFGAIVATKNKEPDGEPLLFSNLKDAEQYGRSTGLVFEPVEVK